MENTAILREWFDRVDSEKSGSITAAQLKNALSVGNLEFTISVVQQMIRMYDFDRNGTMSFEEFVALNKFLLKVQHAFSDLERGRGYLVPDDVYEALVKIGFSLDSPAFYTVCEVIMQNHLVHFAQIQRSRAHNFFLDTVSIKRRMEDSGLMISYLFVSLCNLQGICLIHLIQASKAGSPLISTNLSTALPIVGYEIKFSITSEDYQMLYIDTIILIRIFDKTIFICFGMHSNFCVFIRVQNISEFFQTCIVLWVEGHE